MKVHLICLVCANGHSGAGVAIEPREDDTPELILEVGKREIETLNVVPQCPICGSGLHHEMIVTTFDTVEEASPMMRALRELGNLECQLAAIKRASRN